MRSLRNLTDLRLARALQLMPLFVLDLVLERMPQIGQRLLRHPLRGESVIDRRQDALLDLMQRDGVFRGLSRPVP